MKNWITQTATGFLALVAVLLTSCEKDETQVTLAPASTPTLTASTTNAGVLQAGNAANNAVTYSWTPLTFDVPSATKVGTTVTYTLEFARTGTAFANATAVDAGTGASKALTVGDVNNALIRAGLTPDRASQVDVRLRANYSANQEPLYSTATTLSASPYSRELYAFGSFQGMADVTKAPFIQITDGNPQEYDGYLYMPAATNTFKLSNTNTSSGTVYGSGTAAAGATNSFALNGGDISLPGPGQYRMQVNLVNSSYTATKVVWGVIGSATPNGWDKPTMLTFDPADKKWKGKVTLVAGELKFRANDNWAINFGTNAAGKLVYDSPDNIPGPGPGEYDVVLDLNTPNAYTYSFTKK
ncbi:SusE domain-containing protein [Hymenobacter tibetensis]|uniref:SusE domain-containing protein n=1 Tax=Hymenobacter tibetensis TaxID=497967 RepID=A0ABY4D298_9BACT|nr:SusE domain-containing protein [Hymenobacter tibetensis]UOG76656.1 SusE domain-containing protein [Hymenobacter tibetensis]